MSYGGFYTHTLDYRINVYTRLFFLRKKSTLHALIPSYTFISFCPFPPNFLYFPLIFSIFTLLSSIFPKIFQPTRLFHPTRLLIFDKFSILHVCSILHVYSIVESNVLHDSAKTACSGKFWFSSYGPKSYWPIRLLDFSNLNISRMV